MRSAGTSPTRWWKRSAPRAEVLESRAMPLAAACALMMLAALAASPAVAAEDALVGAQALLSAWHEDPARIDRARALLETAVAANPTPEALTELSRVWFLTGDFRARSEGERVTAYERGMEAGRRAIAAAPQNDQAHLFLAFNTGRTAEIRGVMRALALVGTIREESATVLRLNPANVEGLILAGGLAADLPAMMGGDKTKAEGFFKAGAQDRPAPDRRAHRARSTLHRQQALARCPARAAKRHRRADRHEQAPVGHERSAACQDAARRATRPHAGP